MIAALWPDALWVLIALAIFLAPPLAFAWIARDWHDD